MSSSSEDTLRCPICLEIATKAVETSCCHQVFCEHHAAAGRCPCCRREGVTYVPSFVARRIIDGMPATCAHGCGEKGLTVGRLSAHQEECLAANFSCPSASCSWAGPRREFGAHLVSTHPKALFAGADRLFAPAAPSARIAEPRASAAAHAPAPQVALAQPLALPQQRLSHVSVPHISLAPFRVPTAGVSASSTADAALPAPGAPPRARTASPSSSGQRLSSAAIAAQAALAQAALIRARTSGGSTSSAAAALPVLVGEPPRVETARFRPSTLIAVAAAADAAAAAAAASFAAAAASRSAASARASSAGAGSSSSGSGPSAGTADGVVPASMRPSTGSPGLSLGAATGISCPLARMLAQHRAFGSARSASGVDVVPPARPAPPSAPPSAPAATSSASSSSAAPAAAEVKRPMLLRFRDATGNVAKIRLDHVSGSGGNGAETLQSSRRLGPLRMRHAWQLVAPSPPPEPADAEAEARLRRGGGDVEASARRPALPLRWCVSMLVPSVPCDNDHVVQGGHTTHLVTVQDATVLLTLPEHPACIMPPLYCTACSALPVHAAGSMLSGDSSPRSMGMHWHGADTVHQIDVCFPMGRLAQTA